MDVEGSAHTPVIDSEKMRPGGVSAQGRGHQHEHGGPEALALPPLVEEIACRILQRRDANEDAAPYPLCDAFDLLLHYGEGVQL